MGLDGSRTARESSSSGGDARSGQGKFEILALQQVRTEADGEQAAESISKITVQISPQALDQHFLPLLRRLSGGDWFTSRTSACALFAAPYPKAPTEMQAEMRRMFQGLGADDTPMVRRAVAKALGVSLPVYFVSSCGANHR